MRKSISGSMAILLIVVFSACSDKSAQYEGLGEEVNNSIGMVFKKIPEGSYLMGTAVTRTIDECPKDDPFTEKHEGDDCRRYIKYLVDKRETPQHEVKVNKFYLATTEVTQGQWVAIMGSNPTEFKIGNPDMPIENISWNQAQLFIKKLNEKEDTDRYCLPTEEEWEYAARAGTTSKYFFGDDGIKLKDYTCLDCGTPFPVAQFKPNPWGLYDMYGNVLEWTDSWYNETYDKDRDTKFKVYRGCNFINVSSETESIIQNYRSIEHYGAKYIKKKTEFYDKCRSAYRLSYMRPSRSVRSSGFRVAF